MSLQKLLIIVDGPTEENALRNRFLKDYNDSPKIRLGPGNGKDYSIGGYIKGILPTLIFELSLNSRAIILIPDLERRKMKIENFRDNLREKCIDALVSNSKFKKEDLIEKIFICPPNIMFENWIVSDIKTISIECSEFDSEVKQEKFDGRHGTSILEKNMNCKYKKTVHGSKFFKKTDFTISSSNSDSFAYFLERFAVLKAQFCD
ncbi:MAG TPA: hypothetical protein VL125_08240 [Pelobium sp.]|nr:hypothetical protein [Pelobium sp.]